jgi:VWFA-related protein
VQSNQAALDGRVVVIVMDDASAPVHSEITRRSKALAKDIINRLGPDDQAAVVFTLDTRHAQSLTTDRAGLLAAVDEFRPSTGLVKGATAETYWHYYQSSIGMLTGLAERLAGIPDRRKALAYISVGIPLDPVTAATPTAMAEQRLLAEAGRSNAEGEMQRDLLQMIRTLFSRAQRSNVAIYALDPAGLMGLETILMQPGYGEGLSGSLTLAQASARATLNRDFLHTVADNTGGFAVTEGQGAVSGIERMFEQTAPTTCSASGSTRPIAGVSAAWTCASRVTTPWCARMRAYRPMRRLTIGPETISKPRWPERWAASFRSRSCR